MIQYNEVNIQRILNPTSIDLGEYVINPYKGCVFGCTYCYVRSNRVTKNRGEPWGSYVAIRINAAERLKKELDKYRPDTVLVGSTTDIFQPIERTYRLTGKIISVLNEYGVKYYILTRSPVILDYTDLLNTGNCRGIYFTVNAYDDRLKKVIEPASPSFEKRFEAVKALLACRVPVIPNLSPALPWITDCDTVFRELEASPRLDCECLNFELANIDTLFLAIKSIYPEIYLKYIRMKTDKGYYNDVWRILRERIDNEARRRNRTATVFVHEYKGYFMNKYKNR